MKGIFGWLLLAAALAVPAFLFWNWFKGQNTRGAGLSSPAAGPGLSRLFKTDGEPGPASLHPMGRLAPGSGPMPAALAKAGAGPLSAKPAAALLASKGTAAPAAVSPKPRVKGAVRYEPAGVRDPMVSPLEIAALKKLEEDERLAKEAEEERRRQEEEERRRPKLKAAARGPKEEDLLDLQGVILVGGIRYALVNGDKYKTGDKVQGATILQITDKSVTFSYERRRFKKFMQ